MRSPRLAAAFLGLVAGISAMPAEILASGLQEPASYAAALSGAVEGPSDFFSEKDYRKARSRYDADLLAGAFQRTLESDLPVIIGKPAPGSDSFDFLRALLGEFQDSHAKIGGGSWSSGDLRGALALLRSEDLIDDVSASLLCFELERSEITRNSKGEDVLIRNSAEHHPLSLTRYLERRMDILTERPRARPASKVLPRKDFGQSISVKEAFALQDQGVPLPSTVDLKGQSPRTRLYAIYNRAQIRSLSRLLEVANARIGAGSARLVFETDGQEDIIELFPHDQYRAALRLFQSMFFQLKLSSMFAAQRPLYVDVLAAAFETGALPIDQIDLAAKFDGLADARKSHWHQAFDLARAIFPVPSLAMVLPGYALFAILTVESFYESKKHEIDHLERLFK